MEDLQIFIPIMKVDEEQRTVYGWGAVEEPDNSNEIMDFATSRPNFEAWTNAAQKRSGGQSKGNVRAMHQPIAAGKLVSFQANEQKRGFYVGAKIVDDKEWEKVQQGVYTGFSVGGSYQRRWPDTQNPGLIRYTAKPVELSLVDAPCIPSATFQFVKADGVAIDVPFSPEGVGMELVLEKAIPNSPAPGGDFATDIAPIEQVDPLKEQDLAVSRMPDPFSTTELSPDEAPTAETLTPRHFASGNAQQELVTQISTLAKAVNELIAEISALKKATSPQSGRMIPVRSRFIKVKESSNG